MKYSMIESYKDKILKNPLITGTFILTIAGFLTKILGFFYRIFLSHIFMDEGLGIIGLIAPISILAHSIYSAGLQNAITRYVAASYVRDKIKAYQYLFTGLVLSLSLSNMITVMVYRYADVIALHFLHEQQCAPLIRILALSFPLAALHACINGFFYGCKKTLMPALSQLVEQLARVFCVFLLYRYYLITQQQLPIVITSVGLFLGECVSSCFSLLWLFCTSQREHFSFPRATSLLSVTSGISLFQLAWPISLNRLCISFLSTIETTQLPHQLVQYGLSSAQALSMYGIFSGMAFPLIMFPSALTGSASVLLLPTIAELQSQHKTRKLRKLCIAAILLSFLFGVCCLFFFFLCSDFIGKYLFHNESAGMQIRALSLVCPFLYMSGIMNSILHGLGKTGITFICSLISLSIRLFFVFFIIPILGFYGYLYGIVVSQILLDLLIILALALNIRYN